MTTKEGKNYKKPDIYELLDSYEIMHDKLDALTERVKSIEDRYWLKLYE